MKLKTEAGLFMKSYHAIKKVSPRGITHCLSILFLLFSSCGLFAQETNGRASGRVISDNKEIIAGVTVTLVHEPTQNKYVDITHNDGNFYFFNLKPGGPYTIVFSSAGYETLKKTNLFIHLTGENFLIGNTEITDFFLEKKIISLGAVVVDAHNTNRNKSGVETNISGFTLNSLPSINRNFQDLVRLVPQAKVTGDGVMSLAGQNNRFNSFFIDGGNNNDITGNSVTGMNGGQTGSPPISMEALEEVNILLSPYDVQYGNFTGGSINAITRSGSNETKTSIWYYFRNEDLAGRAPEMLLKPGASNEYYRPKLSDFFNQTFGAWNSGSLAKNKLFYFVLLEKQSETRPQPFSMDTYRGNSNQSDLFGLADFLKDTYQYDPGSFLETKDILSATRMNIKLDWNPSVKDKFSLGYRLNDAERDFPPRVSSSNTIIFENSGVVIPSTTHSLSAEWKRFIKSNMNNRLLLTFTNQTSERNWKRQPFPAVTIIDGDGITITTGSEGSTGVTGLKGNDVTLFNVFKYIKRKHIFTLGGDLNYSVLDNKVLAAYFGAYRFASLNSFINGIAPLRLQRSYYLSEDQDHPSKFHLLRNSFFVNDEIRVRSNLKFNWGLRIDVNSVLSKPPEDKFFNSTGIRTISNYYDLDETTTGKSMKPHWAVSPRISIDYKITEHEINLKAGAGVFVGHIVNAWHFDVFNSNSGSIDIRPQQFIPDPYNQPDSNLRDLNLIAKHFKYPSVFKSSFVAEKKLGKDWTISIEAIFTKNIQDASFKNVNILPPTRRSEPPDSRNIYSTDTRPSPILNSYGTAYLLTNNHGEKGHSYNLSFVIQKQSNNFSFNASYTYGRSWLLFEMTGPQTLVRPQWRNMETVNGRNYATISTSDNDLQHRVTTWVSKRFNYAKSRTATTISLFYNGQSGTPYSYVYANSMINDNGKQGENFDLIYIPTADELASMNFAPIRNSVTNQEEYTPQQQKDFLNDFIESDKYLQKHRGEFAKRNGTRLPFTHTVDLRLQQDFIIKTKKKIVSVTLIYDVFNFTNMLSKNWGRIYFLSNDSFSPITFAGYTNTTTSIIPQYQSKPFTGKPYSLQTSTIPGNSARWISQLGMKINLN